MKIAFETGSIAELIRKYYVHAAFGISAYILYHIWWMFYNLPSDPSPGPSAKQTLLFLSLIVMLAITVITGLAAADRTEGR